MIINEKINKENQTESKPEFSVEQGLKNAKELERITEIVHNSSLNDEKINDAAVLLIAITPIEVTKDNKVNMKMGFSLSGSKAKLADAFNRAMDSSPEFGKHLEEIVKERVLSKMRNGEMGDLFKTLSNLGKKH